MPNVTADDTLALAGLYGVTKQSNAVTSNE